MARTNVGDINPADLAQAGSERARNRIIRAGGKRSRYEAPTFGWYSGYNAINWLDQSQFLHGNEYLDPDDIGAARRRGAFDVMDADDVANAVEGALRSGKIDERTACAVLDGMQDVGNGKLRAVGASAVGFIPLLIPFVAKTAATLATEQALRSAVRRGGDVEIEVHEPEEDVGALREVGRSRPGTGDPYTVGVEAFRGGFDDLIDTDGYRAKLC